MEQKRKDTSKKNKDKKGGRGKKLTAVERRRLERQQRAQSYDDDPLAAFDTSKERRETSFSKDLDSLTTDGLFGGYGSGDTSDGLTDIFAQPQAAPRREEKNEAHSRSETKISPASELTPRQRKLRRTASYIGVFFGIVIIAVALSLTVMFRTTEIRVEAEGLPYSDEEIIKTSGLDYSDNIFLAKRKAAEKKLKETYPYVEGVDVTFRIPGTQIIKIDTAVPSYQVQFSGGFAVVSENSRILEINSAQKNDIPLLKGLKLNQTQPGEYISFEKASTKQILDEVVKNINDNEVPNIYGIDISNTANIELNYDNRITILLGLPEDVGYKLRTAKAIISQQLTANDKGTLDVSLANSDRRSSYFTPIYSDTASRTESNLPSASSKPSDDSNEYLDDIID